VCNSVTITRKEKRLANTDIEISQHALVTFKFLTEFVVFFISSISVGSGKLQNKRHSSMMPLFAVLNNFIKNLMTTQSRECRSALSRELHSSPYGRMGRHLLFTNCRVTYCVRCRVFLFFLICLVAIIFWWIHIYIYNFSDQINAQSSRCWMGRSNVCVVVDS